MLAPGEFLTCPVPPETKRELATRPGDAVRLLETRIAAPTAKAEEPEPRSFLQILLNALGAFHT